MIATELLKLRTVRSPWLLLAVVVKMLMPLVKRRDVVGMIVMVAVFIAIGLLRLPLQAVLLVAVPLSLGITVFMRRRASA